MRRGAPHRYRIELDRCVPLVKLSPRENRRRDTSTSQQLEKQVFN